MFTRTFFLPEKGVALSGLVIFLYNWMYQRIIRKCLKTKLWKWLQLSWHIC